MSVTTTMASSMSASKATHAARRGNLPEAHKAKDQRNHKRVLQSTIRKALNKAEQLRLAAEHGEESQVEELLDEGLDPNIPDAKKRYPIHFAACCGHKQIVELLIQQGADVNVRDINSNSPLHLAVISNHIDIVTQLIRAGADMTVTDVNHKTPVDAARSRLEMLRRRESNNEQLDNEALKILEMLLAYATRVHKDEASRSLEQLQQNFLSISFVGSKVDVLQEALNSLTL